MFDRTVRSVMQRRKMLKAPPDIVVAKAAKLMESTNAGAVMIVEGERLVGIFTERDVVFRVVAQGRDPQATCVAEVMTPSPRTIGPDAPFGYALFIMHEGGFRHLPVVDDGKPVGIVSARSAMDPDLEEFVSEAQRREYFAKKGCG